ncbi:MAG: bifunctional acetate--CoA ligase family protein/GNAT family N-acetyltransferase [Desulforhopalus sp.]
MLLKNLDVMFNPTRIAVIGANEDDTSIGYHIFKNLIGKGFKGIAHPVNPIMSGVQGVEAYSNVLAIPHQIDLALVAVDPGNMLTVLRDCGKKGVKGIVILAPDYTYSIKNPALINEQIKNLPAFYGCRVLGPNSIGFLHPGINLNASLYPHIPQKGNIAFISESGVFSSTFLEHAISKNVGFSYFISLGSKLDINFADTIDFLAGDVSTRAIFLFLKNISNGRRFTTAIRNFARKNPIMIVKPEKADTFSCLSLGESGPLYEEDMIYDALFKRAGCLRVGSIIDLLYLVETIAKQKRPKGRRLMIISNSIAPSEMAMGVLKSMGGTLAVPARRTFANISAGLSIDRELHNPLYLLPDAPETDYQTAIRNCLRDHGVDGVLVICIPCPGLDLKKISKTIAYEAKKYPKTPLFTTWFGEKAIFDQIELLNDYGIPIYVTAEQAVKSFMYMYRYDNNLQLLQETPEIIIKDSFPKTEAARKIIEDCRRRKRYTLPAVEAANILRSYGFPVIETIRIDKEEEAVLAAHRIGYPVAMKIKGAASKNPRSDETTLIHLRDDHEVRKSFTILQSRLLDINGSGDSIVVPPMIGRTEYELILSAQKTLNLGAVIRFGLGGKYLMAEKDYSIGLPPLNQTLARRLIEETKIYSCLQESHPHRESRLRCLEEILVRFSQLIVDFPQIDAIDIDPLIVTVDDCIVRDATIQLDRHLPSEYQWATGDLCPPHLSIPPYPFKYEKNITLSDDTVIHIRPIRSEDEPALRHFFETLSRKTVFFRFGQHQINMPHDHLARFCQVDYDRDLAFLAFCNENQEVIIGDVRLNRLADFDGAELSFVVADRWQEKGVGSLLMDFCIMVAKEIGIQYLLMNILKSNKRMQQFGYKYGFTSLPSEEEDDMEEFRRKIS